MIDQVRCEFVVYYITIVTEGDFIGKNHHIFKNVAESIDNLLKLADTVKTILFFCERES